MGEIRIDIGRKVHNWAETYLKYVMVLAVTLEMDCKCAMFLIRTNDDK